MDRFQEACDKVINKERRRNGIGTLGEKTIHAVLKHYFEPDEAKHEVRQGRYVADIAREDGIIEIQTRSFNTLRKKLEVFLELGQVTVVYPIPYIKWLQWINIETGEIGKRRKSNKKGTPYLAFHELYKIKAYLTHPNLRICLVLVNIEEYRLLNGWSRDKKRGSERYDRIPVELVDEIYIRSAIDYQLFIPESLAEGFTSMEYKMATGLSLTAAQTALNVLNYVGAVARTGKKGRSFIYQKY